MLKIALKFITGFRILIVTIALIMLFMGEWSAFFGFLVVGLGFTDLAGPLSVYFYLEGKSPRSSVSLIIGIVFSRAGGKIVNTASMLSFQGSIIMSSYTASKSAVMGLTRLMANMSWGIPHKINVNAVAPDYMATNNTAALRADPDRNKAILDRIPAGRWGEPDDLKGLAVFLDSAASDYISGYTIAVDGGWLSR